MPGYRAAEPLIRQALSHVDLCACGGASPPKRTRYRFVAWNIERGARVDAQLAVLRSHAYLQACDLLLLTETDLGMARSGNRAIARKFARELQMHCAFAPSYLNLTKGSGRERDVPGENRLGLHGNAVLSRYPIRAARRIALPRAIDALAGPEKRLGCEAAVAAEIEFPGFTVTAVSVHLEAHSGQRRRRDQMNEIVAAIAPAGPAVIGGDWNTTTCNSSSAWHARASVWRALVGMETLIHHHLHPYAWFERHLFAALDRHGFDYRACNLLGERTACHDVADAGATRSLADWVPLWCLASIRWALRNHGGRCPLKLDWFATRELNCAEPAVIHDLRDSGNAPLSDHDPIGVDILA